MGGKHDHNNKSNHINHSPLPANHVICHANKNHAYGANSVTRETEKKDVFWVMVLTKTAPNFFFC